MTPEIAAILAGINKSAGGGGGGPLTYTEESPALTASDAATNDQFGFDVCVSGNGLVLAVVPDVKNAVYIYDRVGSAWVERIASWAPVSPGIQSVGLNYDGSVLVIGEINYSTYRGRCVLYDWDGGLGQYVVRIALIQPTDIGSTDSFGSIARLNDDGTVLLSASVNWDGASTNQGAGYIFDISGSTATQRGAAIVTATPGSNAYMGWGGDLSGDGNVIVLGSRNNPQTDRGSFCLFEWNGSGWNEVITNYRDLAANYNNARYAYSCALNYDGSLVLVGFTGYTDTVSSQGTIILYDRSGATLTERERLIASSPTSEGLGTGCYISSDESIIVAGAGWYSGAYSTQGRVITWTGA